MAIMNRCHQVQLLALSWCLLSVLAACSTPQQGTGQPAGASKQTVLATSSIVADWVQQVAGDHFTVRSIVPRGTDPHAYTPGPRDMAAVADAGVVFTVGLGFEAAWFGRLTKGAATDPTRIVALGEHARTIPTQGDAHREGNDHKDEEEEGHTAGAVDPHFWFDPRETKRVLPAVVEGLASLKPAARDTLAKNAATYAAQLDDLHAAISAQAAGLPAERRLLVTAHESLGYFAAAYRLRLVGSVIPGVSTTREPSAAELAALVGEIRQLKAPAIFGESILDARLARRVAEETGAKLVTGLHTDSLGPEGSATGDYLSMMRTTASTIFAALR